MKSFMRAILLNNSSSSSSQSSPDQPLLDPSSTHNDSSPRDPSPSDSSSLDSPSIDSSPSAPSQPPNDLQPADTSLLADECLLERMRNNECERANANHNDLSLAHDDVLGDYSSTCSDSDDSDDDGDDSVLANHHDELQTDTHHHVSMDESVSGNNDGSTIDGGLVLAKKVRIVVFYTDIFVTYAPVLVKFLNDNGLPCIDITAPFNQFLETECAVSVSTFIADTSDRFVPSNEIKNMCNEWLAKYADTKVLLFNVSRHKVVSPFAGFTQFFLTTKFPVLSCIHSYVNIMAIIDDCDNVYEMSETKIIDGETLKERINSVLIHNFEKYHLTRNTIIRMNAISNWCYNREFFIDTFLPKTLRTIVSFKPSSDASPLLVDTDIWETIILNRLKAIG